MYANSRDFRLGRVMRCKNRLTKESRPATENAVIDCRTRGSSVSTSGGLDAVGDDLSWRFPRVLHCRTSPTRELSKESLQTDWSIASDSSAGIWRASRIACKLTMVENIMLENERLTRCSRLMGNVSSGEGNFKTVLPTPWTKKWTILMQDRRKSRIGYGFFQKGIVRTTLVTPRLNDGDKRMALLRRSVKEICVGVSDGRSIDTCINSRERSGSPIEAMVRLFNAGASPTREPKKLAVVRVDARNVNALTEPMFSDSSPASL